MAETKKTTTAKKPAVKKEVATKTTTKKTVAPKVTTTKAAPKTSSTAKTTKTVAPKATTTKTTSTAKKATTPKVAPLATTKLNFDSSVLPKELFASEKIYTQAVFDTIMSERASRRQGTHDVKNRSEVSGGGKKPWKQKGTGRARAGSTRSPIWVGGGQVFGPTPERNYNLKVNKKVRFAAFVSALTQLANNNAVVVNNFELSEISTKKAVAKLSELNIANLKHILIVNDDVTVFKSLQNVPNVIVVKPASVLVEQLVLADVLVLSEEALKVFAGRVK